MTALSSGLLDAHDRAAAALRRVEAALTVMEVDAAAHTGQAHRHRHHAQVEDARGDWASADAYRHDATLHDAAATQLHEDATRIRRAIAWVPEQRGT